ncbi:MAG TPA: gliding motility-associated C-terminal domain-containing protein [Flavisolibacter sp.]|nr:gliding motility-associated C-terminal domain-containing protein [Flavisolibacter sp.]
MKACLNSKYLGIRQLWASFLFCMVTCYAQAQLCTGSLGDPVVNITFGNNGPVGSPLGAAVTSYTFLSADCPNDGMYSVRSSTSSCYGTWHTVNSDHTGDPQGRFMLVNASFDPGDFYVETVTGLCANTTYEFAAWLMNVVRVPNQIKPNITFVIEKRDGTILGSFSSGDIDITSTPQWKKYGFNFKTPPGVFEVVLRVKNNAPGGIGNDLALDDITFRACGPSINNLLNGSTDTVQLCEGDVRSFSLKAQVPAFFFNPTFQWQLSSDEGRSWQDIPGAGSLDLEVTPTAVGKYWYRLSAAEAENFSALTCRIYSNITAIIIHANPIVSAGPDKVVVKGNSIRLESSLLTEGGIFNWQPTVFMENSSLLSPIVNPTSDITYTLSARSAFGCVGQDMVSIKVINGIYIPNSFTPNQDGSNDTWHIPFIEYAPDADVKVFNRYGGLVYQARGSAVAWDGTVAGKPQPTGVYVYLVSLKKGDPPIKGFITLIR